MQGIEQNAKGVTSKGAQNKFNKEECASGTERRSISSDVALKDAKIEFNKQECASGMEQISSDAASMDAQSML